MEGNRLLPNLSIKKIWAKLTELDSKTEHKAGSYVFWANGAEEKNVVFSLPFTSERHVFYISANIATVPYMSLCLVNGITSEAKAVTMTKLTENDISSIVTVSASTYEGYLRNLRIKINTPANMGSLIQIVVPDGTVIHEW